MQVGYGILSWDGSERRSNRYGAVVLDGQDYHCSSTVEVRLDPEAVAALESKRVRLWAVVVEARESGHIGDMFLKIKPSKPEVGEVIELGVGVFRAEPAPWGGLTQVVLVPGDGRKELWIDPRALYRGHDQTVELHAELTEAPFSEVPVLDQAEADGCLSTGETDGSLQTKGVPEGTPFKIFPEFRRIGDGLFEADGTPQYGKRFNVLVDDPDGFVTLPAPKGSGKAGSN